MKVTFASYDFGGDIGGVSSWLIRLLPLLRARGIDADAHLFHIGEGPAVTGHALTDSGVPVQVAPWPPHSEAGTRQCLAWLARRLPDIYVPNCIVPAYHALRYVKPAGVGSIGVLHTDQETSQGLLEEFVSGPPARRVDAMVAVSTRLEAAARRLAPPNVRVRRIPCGVPLPAGRAASPAGTFRLVYAGRLSEDAKRIGDVTRAIVKAAERWPDVEAWLIGEGPERGNVERIIAQSSAARRIRLLGRQPLSEMQSLLAQCHAYVLLSDYEGLPVSMLEAMSVGLVPIVHREAGGVAEVVADGRNGFIVNDRDDDFLRALAEIHDDTRRWGQIATAARVTIENAYSVERGADGWCELFAEVVRGRTLEPTWTPPRRVRLPPANPKLGWFDLRPPSAPRQVWTQTRMLLGRYRSTLRRMFQGDSPHRG